MSDLLPVNTKAWWEKKCLKYLNRKDYRDREEFKICATHMIYPVLEVGSAFGAFTKYLPEDAEYLGVELSTRMYDLARKAYPNRQFVNEDIFKLSNKYKKKFSTVCAFQLLEHFEYLPPVIERLKFFAKDRIVISVPRGHLHSSSIRNDGHFREWLDDYAFKDEMKRYGKLSIFKGAANHICGVLTWPKKKIQ